MFMGGTIQQWQDVILYIIFMLMLFTAIGFISLKISIKSSLKVFLNKLNENKNNS